MQGSSLIPAPVCCSKRTSKLRHKLAKATKKPSVCTSCLDSALLQVCSIACKVT
jgi:hypothetical protein